MAIFEGRVPDRSAVKVVYDEKVPRVLEPVRDLALEKTDLMWRSGSAFNVYCGVRSAELIEVYDEPTDSPEWVEQVTVYDTPEGDLREVFTKSVSNKPGYEKEYLLKEPEDIRKLLSLPYEPYMFSTDAYREADTRMGDAGIVMFCLDHAMYALQRLIGSENFALWSVEAEEQMFEVMQMFASRIRDHASAAIDAGIRGVFGWLGPELCIPPLMSPAAFDKYVFGLDKPLIDLIHEAGGRVRVHCHGRMKAVLERFVEMGVDVLNPIEPPPMGDMTLGEAFGVVGERMGLEGNIETHDMMTCTKESLREKIHAALDAGRGRRFVLCPCSGYIDNLEPTPQDIENWLFYIDEGVRYAEQMG